MPEKPSEQALRNRAHWDRESDEYQERHREFINRSEPRWGVWQIPESELNVLGDVNGKDVLELGCGAAQWSILLAKRGARPVALDNSQRQLEHGYFGMHELDDGDVVAYQLPYGEWIRLFRANGLEVEDLIEPRPGPDAESTYWGDDEREWARRWPSESIWKARKAG